MTARNRVVREPYATWCGRTPVEIIHGLLPDFLQKVELSIFRVVLVGKFGSEPVLSGTVGTEPALQVHAKAGNNRESAESSR